MILDGIGEPRPTKDVAAPGIALAQLGDQYIEIASAAELLDCGGEVDLDGLRDGGVGLQSQLVVFGVPPREDAALPTALKLLLEHLNMMESTASECVYPHDMALSFSPAWIASSNICDLVSWNSLAPSKPS